MKINETTGLYENYGIWHIPFWQTEMFALGVKIACAFVLCVLCFVAVWLYLRHKKRKKMSPAEQIVADLCTLKTEYKVQVACGKEFYVSLSDIIKRYFFYCHGYDVLGKTDAELIEYLINTRIDQKIVDDIQYILHGSEVIKFANAQAVQERIVADYDKVCLLVKNMQKPPA